MASAFTHGLVAAVLVRSWPLKDRPGRLYGLAVACSILPDADVIAFSLGIPYEHLLGHRGLSHSLLFALLLGILTAQLLRKRDSARRTGLASIACCLFAITASHGVLDAMTNGGLGVAFFAPFDESRYFLPWRPLQVSPVSVAAFLSRWGLEVLISEFLWIWIPCLTLMAILLWIGRIQSAGPRL